MSLDAKGRCFCGQKPIRYKREQAAQLFCYRCARAYDPETLEQIENWAWKKNPDGTFPPARKDGA